MAGMVYLDRPSPAGYFIFPDLSVRHEGVYRLSFSLYEELKNLGDEDKIDDSRAGTPGDAHVTHRLEVKSVPFFVFSAKKFPGLTESTSLSRIVAEQGCRVRIRRDVRMRRRDVKSSDKDWDHYEDDTAGARARMSSTPEGNGVGAGYPSVPAPSGYMDPTSRPRSASNASHHSLANTLSRRTSLQEMNQSYPQPFGTAPHTPQHAYGQASPYGPSPSQQFSQPPFVQQHSTMQPPPPQYGSQAYPPPPMPASEQPHHNYYSVPQPQYASAEPVTQAQRMMEYPSHVAPEHRRTSSQWSIASSASQSNYAPVSHPAAQHYPPPPPTHQMYPAHSGQQSSFGPQDPYNKPPPLQPVQPPARASGANTPLSGRSSFDQRSLAPLPPLQMPADMANKLEPSSPATAQPQSSYHPTPLGDKRSYGDVFNTRYQDQPLRQGARPGTPGYGQSSNLGGLTNGTFAADDDDQLLGGDVPRMDEEFKYRRADGRPITRTLPHYQSTPLDLEQTRRRLE